MLPEANWPGQLGILLGSRDYRGIQGSYTDFLAVIGDVGLRLRLRLDLFGSHFNTHKKTNVASVPAIWTTLSSPTLMETGHNAWLQGLGFRVWGSGFRTQGSWFGVPAACVILGLGQNSQRISYREDWESRFRGPLSRAAIQENRLSPSRAASQNSTDKTTNSICSSHSNNGTRRSNNGQPTMQRPSLQSLSKPQT